jgi:uroporphyrin-III C-methyltransferase/precorrin-2 dehydrogenase/sirohydrochlorin ferrochelatase
LIEHAQQGKRVVRLKGGDPFIFGRGGEELQALAKARIDFSVVPGISAALGGAAYAGIPLTHREYAHSVSFVTGHAQGDGPEPDWRAVAQPGTTAVFYMGLARLEYIVAKLLEHGAPDTRPVGIIAQATTADQRVITGTLSTIRALSAEAKLASPALLIVGEVVALHSSLAWFGTESGIDLSRTA